jgi:hypothetical protein
MMAASASSPIAVILSAGLVCPAGPNLEGAIANYRSNRTFFRKEPALIGADGLPPILAAVHELHLNYVDRLTRLLRGAIDDCLKPLSLVEGTKFVAHVLLPPVMVDSPSRRPFEIWLRTNPHPHVSRFNLWAGGSADALGLIETLARQTQGEPHLLVALDSLIHHELIDVLAYEERILNRYNPYGFIPGEAAVSLLLSSETREPNPSAPLGRILVLSQNVEREDPVAPHAVRGRALADCVRACAAYGPFAKAVAHLNGERNRAEEFGFASAAAPASVTESLMDPEVLALKMGDLGCAASLVGLTLALHLVDADAACLRILVLAESRHNGNRAALVAERVASSLVPT